MSSKKLMIFVCVLLMFVCFGNSYLPPTIPLRRRSTSCFPGIQGHNSFENSVTRSLRYQRRAKSNNAIDEDKDSSVTLYEILGIRWGASQQDIRKAYGSLAKKYHPDVTGNDAQSTEYFYLVKDAYEVLSDDILRARYNNVLMSQGYVPPKGSVRRSQELGMSEWQFYLVVLLVNPFYLFLLGPLFGIKVEDVKGFLGLD